MVEPSSPRCEVIPYTIDNLKNLFVAKSLASGDLVEAKLHNPSFERHFQESQARTIVIENDYMDRDFLADFGGYYFRCFRNYKRTCTRLHFFKKPFDEKLFLDFLGRGKITHQAILELGYLGFIVIKPLPKTIIGMTCLKPVEQVKQDIVRAYPNLRKYRPNLFGLPLEVDTLAFQEQDRVVGSCATSALWTTFQGTGVLFQHHIPSPVEITNAANFRFISESRILPSHGLSHQQMSDAIRGVGLEPYSLNLTDIGEDILKANLYAYLRAGIPIIMACDLIGTSIRQNYHTVAVTGYRMRNGPYKPEPKINLKAFQIDEIYVHDDQVGPFAPMTFGKEITFQGAKIISLSTDWKGKGGRKVEAVSRLFLIPLYPTIRIPFNIIYSIIMGFDEIFNEMMINISQEAPEKKIFERLEWDIYLSTINQVKCDVIGINNLPPEYRKKILIAHMPRYIWRASAYREGILALDLLFDPTDIETGELFVRPLQYDPDLSHFLCSMSRTFKGKDLFKNRDPVVKKIYESFEEDRCPEGYS